MAFRVVQGLVGAAENDDGRLIGVDADEAHADGDSAHLREVVRFDIGAEAVDDLLRIFQGDRAQQHDEFLAAEAEDAVLRAERRLQLVGDQDQHFIAIQVAKFIVDQFEMIDVDHGQPLPLRVRMVAPFFIDGTRLLRFRFAAVLQDFCQLVVEGLAIQ